MRKLDRIRVKRMKKPEESRVLIIGLARNIESKIENEIRNLQSAFSDFLDIRFLILESDSDDHTAKRLEEISRLNSNVEFQSLGNLRTEIPNRIDRISFCRTKAQELARAMFANSDYVVVADLDGVNTQVNREAIKSCWDGPIWDVCTANQEHNYYDIYALRHPLLAPHDCWLEYLESRRGGAHPMKALTHAVFSRQVHIPRESKWIEVDSAFGGLAIYKVDAFLAGKYMSRRESGEVICEHVPFHESIKSEGKRLFINPKLVNSAGINKGSFSYKLVFVIKYLVSLFSPEMFDRKFMR